MLMCVSSSAGQTAGTAICWGWDFNGECTPPSGQKFVKVSAGHRFSLGINSNNQIVHWGWTANGRGNIPSGDVFVQVSAGYDHGLALDATGNVYAWGGGDPNAGLGWDQGTVPSDPRGDSVYTQVSAGEAFNLVLRADGTIWHWGRDSEGQDDIPHNETGASGFVPYVAIDAGGHHGIGLRADGSIQVWGGQNYTCTTQGVLPSFPSDTPFIAVGAGHITSYAVKSDRSVVWWGGCNGCNTEPVNHIDIQHAFIDGGYGHAYARTASSHVYAWGSPCTPGGGTLVFAEPHEVPSFLANAVVLSAATGHSNHHNIVIIMD
ncbi:MAG: hypothetical protein KF678_04615 [Phycisphaeraceae bacterium]|nr:hypothetical protein [Phycisphaeraceae bacterium]